MDDRPETALTRHFFRSLFDLGFLSDDGAEALKRALLGSLAVAAALGLLLTRVFMIKYGELSAEPVDHYMREVLADHAFLIAVPMWFVASAVVLVGHSLFPGQTDFRILMAEPLSRLTIFASKLAALLLFIGLFVAGTHLALFPLAAFTLVGMMKTGSILTAPMAFWLSSLSGSLFAALSVVAVHGLLVTFATPARVLAFSGAVRSVLIAVLVLSFPLMTRLPATADAFASAAWWLSWTPPAWFAGLERWLIGDGRYAALAAEAGIATVLVVIISAASYLRLYRRFDQVMTQSASARRASDRNWLRHQPVGRAPVRLAIRRFVSVTIRRSVLHQGLIVGLLTAAGAFVLNSLLNATGWHESLETRAGSRLILTLLWAPMAMMFLAIPAIRVALSVPVDLRSNWVFRMTEDIAGRSEIAAANVRIVLALGVMLPICLIAPVQWWALGSSAVGIFAIEALIGWLLVEWVMMDWSRIPFTCSYIPGKGFVPVMFVKGFAFYLAFSMGTMLILRLSLVGPGLALVVALIAGTAAAALSLYRRRQAPLTPLLFDDELPTDINPLRLNAD